MVLNYTWAAQLIREVFHLGASFNFWFRCICVPPSMFCGVSSLSTRNAEGPGACVKSLHSCRSWWSGRQVVRRYHNSRCREVLEAFLRTSRLRTIFSVAKVSESLKYHLPGQGICMVLYCTSLNIWCTDATRLLKVFEM